MKRFGLMPIDETHFVCGILFTKPSHIFKEDSAS